MVKNQLFINNRLLRQCSEYIDSSVAVPTCLLNHYSINSGMFHLV